jgi:hypothetical protein
MSCEHRKIKLDNTGGEDVEPEFRKFNFVQFKLHCTIKCACNPDIMIESGPRSFARPSTRYIDAIRGIISEARSATIRACERTTSVRADMNAAPTRANIALIASGLVDLLVWA